MDFSKIKSLEFVYVCDCFPSVWEIILKDLSKSLALNWSLNEYKVYFCNASFLRYEGFFRILNYGCVFYFLVEYVSGGTLGELLKDDSISLSWKQRAVFAKGISEGMVWIVLQIYYSVRVTCIFGWPESIHLHPNSILFKWL